MRRRQMMGIGGTIPGIPLVHRINVKYNSTDWTYLGGYLTGANVIASQTIVPDTIAGQPNANTGLAYDFETDLFIVKEFETELNHFFDRDLNEVLTIHGNVAPVQGVGKQGIAYSFVDRIITEYDGTSLRSIDLTGTQVASQAANAPVGFTSGGLFRNPFTDELLLTNVTSGKIQLYEKSGGLWVRIGETVYGAFEGIGYDFIEDLFVLYFDAIRLRTRDGLYNRQYPVGTTAMRSVTEGIVCDPRDRTFWYNSDLYFHGGTIGGNLLTHSDVLAVYGKYIRWPDMENYSLFLLPSGVVRSGLYNQENIIGPTSSLDWVYSPIIDFQAFTGQNTLSNWTFPTDVQAEFRSSSSAPAGVAAPVSGIPPHNFDFYDANQGSQGWGSTVPSAFSSSPVGSNRYLQFRFKTAVPVPPVVLWTPASLPGIVSWTEPCALDNVGKSAYSNDVEIWLNKANLSNVETGSMVQSTASLTPQWNASLYQNIASIRHIIYNLQATLLTEMVGEVVIVWRRKVATTRVVLMSAGNTGSTSSQFRFCHFASSAGVLANMVGLQVVNDAGAVTINCGFVVNDQNWHWARFGQDGTELYLYIDGVKRVISFSTGSNSGNIWYGMTDITNANQVATGAIDNSGATFTGDGDFRLQLVLNQKISDADSALLDAYIQGLNYLGLNMLT